MSCLCSLCSSVGLRCRGSPELRAREALISYQDHHIYNVLQAKAAKLAFLGQEDDPYNVKAKLVRNTNYSTTTVLKQPPLSGSGYSGYPPGTVLGMLERGITPHRVGCDFSYVRSFCKRSFSKSCTAIAARLTSS